MPDHDKPDNALLIDLDGVIYQSDRIIEGAVETLDWIRQQHIPHLFVTNTTSRSRSALLDKFEALGFNAAIEDVVTPIVAARQWLRTRNLTRLSLLIGEDAREEFADFENVVSEAGGMVDAVVIGDLGEDWNYQVLNRAFRQLMQTPRPELVALGMTRYWRGADGLNLDVAPFVRALEHATSCEAQVMGKPAPAFFHASLDLLQYRPEHTYMIGDDIDSDVAAAQHCGIRGIQVRTGKFLESDLERDIEPHAILDSIADLPAWWQCQA